MTNVSFSSINVINGEELGDTPQVSLQVAGKRTARAGETLMIFLDLPNASPSTCADIARTLNDGLMRAPGGVTSALRLAIKLANDRILQLNKGAPPNQRLEGSISCALVSDEGVIIAQAGPAIAFARARSGAFEVVAPSDEGASQVIGVSASIDPQFNNFAPQPGDVFVLTGARSMIGVNDALVSACMAKGDARLVAGYLNANVKQGRMIGVALSVDSVAALSQSATTVAAPASHPAAPVAAPVAAATRATPVEPSPSAPPVASPMGEAVKDTMNQAARSVQRSLNAFGGRLLPQDSPAEVEQRSRTATFILAAIAVLIPIIVVVTVAVLYFQFSGEAERLQLRSNAQAQVEAASNVSVSDPTRVKSDWGAALQLIADYEAKNPDDTTTFAEAKMRARAQLDQLGKIARVQPLELARFDGSAQRRIAASALGVYALNKDTNTAEYLLNPQNAGTTGKKTEITFNEGLTTTSSALADVAWATTSSDRWRTEGAVLFGMNSIFEYSSATGRASPIAIPTDADTTPLQVQAGELYNNTVYLLDAGVGQIWRYSLAGDALGKGNSYFRSPYNPLKESVDFAIDGAIYVLQKNGALLKYFNRQPVQFTLDGLPEPLNRVVALAAGSNDPNRGSLYILDAGAGSVVELTKTGQFVRQYRGEGDEFVDAQDMSLDGASNTMYVATRDRLFSFPIEPPARPAEPEQTPTATE